MNELTFCCFVLWIDYYSNIQLFQLLDARTGYTISRIPNGLTSPCHKDDIVIIANGPLIGSVYLDLIVLSRLLWYVQSLPQVLLSVPDPSYSLYPDRLIQALLYTLQVSFSRRPTVDEFFTHSQTPNSVLLIPLNPIPDFPFLSSNFLAVMIVVLSSGMKISKSRVARLCFLQLHL